MSKQQVCELLKKFQMGYTQRDLNKVDEFMTLFVEDDSLEVIGTNAIKPGQNEWCQGVEAVRNLVASDWEHWGDVFFDIDKANIFTKGDVAWISTIGTVTDTIPPEECYTSYLDFVANTLQEKELNHHTKVFDILELGIEILVGAQQGETYVWPFRFTAVAVKNDDLWRFHHMQFSFPTTHAPDVRVV